MNHEIRQLKDELCRLLLLIFIVKHVINLTSLSSCTLETKLRVCYLRHQYLIFAFLIVLFGCYDILKEIRFKLQNLYSNLIEVSIFDQVLVDLTWSLHIFSQSNTATLGISIVSFRKFDVRYQSIQVIDCQRHHVEILQRVLLIAYQQLQFCIVVFTQVLQELQDLLLDIEVLLVYLNLFFLSKLEFLFFAIHFRTELCLIFDGSASLYVNSFSIVTIDFLQL